MRWTALYPETTTKTNKNTAETDFRGHKICSTICGTPVQAISDHKDLTELAWGVREGQNLSRNGLNLALKFSTGP